MFEVLTNQKNKPLLSINSYAYTVYYVGRTRTTWRCTDRGCIARVKTPNGLDIPDIEDQFEYVNDHNHISKPFGKERENVKNVMNIYAQETDNSPGQIINKVLSGFKSGDFIHWILFVACPTT